MKSPGIILGVLSALALNQTRAEPPFVPRTLSPFQMKKAESLLRSRLPCLGCHELDGDGGRIGPSLSSLKGLRSAEYVYQMIRDPQHIVPGTLMPRVPMSPSLLELVANYLVQRAATPSPAAPAVTQAPGAAARTADTSGAPLLYGRWCASCHGAGGGGDGYNAPFLPTRPTAHRDAAYMATRTDDELFDTIAAGGYVMNRSNRMPPFGETLTAEQIWSLVGYLRTLCRCRGPAWSLDNR